MPCPLPDIPHPAPSPEPQLLPDSHMALILATGSHKLEVKVGGDSMLARLLRKTIGALNTSSEAVVESNTMRE